MTVRTTSEHDGDVLPSEAEVRGYLDSLSNWNRWGSSDTLGTLNLLTRAKTLAAVRLVQDGKSVTCSLPVTYEEHPDNPDPETGTEEYLEVPRHTMIRSGTDIDPTSEREIGTSDQFTIAPHGLRVTHLDAPCHTILRGCMYNGISAALVTREGAKTGNIEEVRNGIVGRGVLFDVPLARGVDFLPEDGAVFPEDLERCEEIAGIRAEPGDILIVRTGFRAYNRLGPVTGPSRRPRWPGLQARCLPWLRERDIAVLATDSAADVRPHGYDNLGLPIHTVGMWAMGMWILDNCDLEKLSTECASRKRWHFLFVIAPIYLTDATGAPANPLAIF
jgi:kynurenine formamidase